MSSPTVNHGATVEHLLCYLKEAPRHGILYKKHEHTRIKCFLDTNKAGSKEDRRSTSGYCYLFTGDLISQKSKKQSVVSQSSVESEYGAI